MAVKLANLDKLTIHGFKSIERLDDFALGPLNVLIGANGAGKSNFVEFFRLLRAMVNEGLQQYVNTNGPADGFFFKGVKRTNKITAEMCFGQNRYSFELVPTADGRIMIQRDQVEYVPKQFTKIITQSQFESALKNRKDEVGVTSQRGPNWYVWQSVSSWQVYHFHDTSMGAGLRRGSGIEQTDRLEPSGENLAAFLLGLRGANPEVYKLIRSTIQRMAPYFDDFKLGITVGKSEDQVRLTWKQRGSDYTFSPGHLSDGTIRFIALTTALLQPSPPSTVVIDEPELGLHPEALAILAGLVRSASSRMQIILATQSPIFLSEFDPDQVVTVNQVDGSTCLRRLDKASLEGWLVDFSLGDLWLKGTIPGGIGHA